MCQFHSKQNLCVNILSCTDAAAADQVTHYEYLGCYRDRSDRLNTRALRGYSEDSDDNTLEQCTSVCLNQNQGLMALIL